MSEIEQEREDSLAERGPQFLIRLAAMLRTARTHDVSNQAFQRQLKDFMQLLSAMFEEDSGQDEVALAAAVGYFYLNAVRIRAQASLLPVYHWLMAEFERRSLGGVRFLSGVHEAELERFFQLFLAAEDAALAARIAEAMREASIEHIVAVPASALDTDDLEASLDHRQENERGRAKKVFWHAVLGTRRIVARARQNGRPDLRQAKRLVQPVVDSIMRHEYSVVGLTALRDHDEYTYAHCVNVSIVSVGIGQALGLSRQVLADLGVAALLHDVGKVAIPREVLQKPGRLDAQEWHLMQRHPLEGAKMMSRMPGLTGLTLDSMRVCLEHHMNFDRTGYPDVDMEWGQATLSRIVAVADCFDAITAHRTYHSRPRTAFEALQYMLGPTRVGFDPAVLWGLVRTVGLYPAGSVLETDDHHLVLTLSPAPGDVRRPNCRILARPDGTTLSEDHVEEWTPMPDERHVVRVLSPEDHAFDTTELIAA